MLVFLTLVVPEIVIAVSTLIFFVNLGFDLGPLTMFIGHTVFNASLVMLIVRARFVSMGYSLEEASMDLGASRIATFRQVTLPRLAPAIIAGLLLSFTFSFDDVVISNFTAGAGNDTWPLRVLAGLRFGLRPDLNATATMMLARDARGPDRDGARAAPRRAHAGSVTGRHRRRCLSAASASSTTSAASPIATRRVACRSARSRIGPRPSRSSARSA